MSLNCAIILLLCYVMLQCWCWKKKNLWSSTLNLIKNYSMGSLLSFNYQFFCLKNIGGAKELVVLLWLSGNIWNKQWIKSVGLQLTLVRIGFLLFCQIIIRPIYYISDRQVLRTFASRMFKDILTQMFFQCPPDPIPDDVLRNALEDQCNKNNLVS